MSNIIPRLLAGYVAADSLNQAQEIIRSNKSLIAVTRDGDLVGRGRASGGSSAKSSLIEITAMIEKSEIDLVSLLQHNLPAT